MDVSADRVDTTNQASSRTMSIVDASNTDPEDHPPGSNGERTGSTKSSTKGRTSVVVEPEDCLPMAP